MIPDRSHKAQAPPPLVPTGRWTPAETLDHFLKSREKTIAYMKSTPDLRAHVVATKIRWACRSTGTNSCCSSQPIASATPNKSWK